MAAIFAYFSALNNGELDESYHIWFFVAAVIGSVLVAGGILLESHWPLSRMKVRERWGITLVILGVVIEASFTFALLTFDEGVSRKQQSVISAQQSKIISLEENASARVLNKKQYDAILSLKDKVKSVNIMPEQSLESIGFASWITNALLDAGVTVRTYTAPPGFATTGLMIVYPDSLETVGKLENEPLFKAFMDAGLTPGAGSFLNMLFPVYVPRNIPLIFVGEKGMILTHRPYVGEKAQ